MDHTYSALALSALALGPVALTTPGASALHKDPAGPFAAYTESRDAWPASAQMGTSALGGAALAFGGMWLYRRRTLAS